MYYLKLILKVYMGMVFCTICEQSSVRGSWIVCNIRICMPPTHIRICLCICIYMFQDCILLYLHIYLMYTQREYLNAIFKHCWLWSRKEKVQLRGETLLKPKYISQKSQNGKVGCWRDRSTWLQKCIFLFAVASRSVDCIAKWCPVTTIPPKYIKSLFEKKYSKK